MATRIFKDIDLSFAKHPQTSDILLKYDENAIKNSIKNLILTKHYERPFHSEIGSSVSSMLFEIPNPGIVRVIRQEIIDTIENFEPRAEVLDVEILFDRDNYYMMVTITFRIRNTQTPITVQFTLDRTR